MNDKILTGILGIVIIALFIGMVTIGESLKTLRHKVKSERAFIINYAVYSCKRMP